MDLAFYKRSILPLLNRVDRVQSWIAAAIIAALIVLFPAVGSAHTVPSDVTVQVFVKPSGDHLNVLVRVPLKAMSDMEFPVRENGNLDLNKVDASLHEGATRYISDMLEVYEDGRPLLTPRIVAARISLESDRSFESYEDAFAHVTGTVLPANTQVFWNQTMADVLFEYPIQSERSNFAVHPGFDPLGLRVVTVLRFLPPGGAVRAFEFIDDPGLVRLDPRWYQASFHFVELGFYHILDGTDHLLFLFCLVIPFRRFRALIPIVTSFTVAHSITLIGSAYHFAPDTLWFPPLIETLIAMSIVYMALENIVGTSNVERRWLITFGFGMVHGFGFSFALRQTLQFAGTHLLASLLSFNIGVELGQLLVLLLLIPALDLLFRYVVAERMGTIILSALVAHTAWHWMIDRGEQLRQFRFQWPTLTIPMLVSVMHWLMFGLILAGLIWLVIEVLPARWVRGTDSKAARSR